MATLLLSAEFFLMVAALLHLLTICSLAYAQVGTRQKVIKSVYHTYSWGVRAAGLGNITVSSMAIAADGGIALAGVFNSPSLELFNRQNNSKVSASVFDGHSAFVAVFTAAGR